MFSERPLRQRIVRAKFHDNRDFIGQVWASKLTERIWHSVTPLHDECNMRNPENIFHVTVGAAQQLVTIQSVC